MAGCVSFNVIFSLLTAFKEYLPAFSRLKRTFCFCGYTCAVQLEVRYFRTRNRIFPGSLFPERWSRGTKTLGGYEGHNPSISFPEPAFFLVVLARKYASTGNEIDWPHPTSLMLFYERCYLICSQKWFDYNFRYLQNVLINSRRSQLPRVKLRLSLTVLACSPVLRAVVLQK